MSTTAKLLVLGPPDGAQGAFVSAVSEVKVRSSARTPTATGEGYVPMDFGRVRIALDLDLQLFGFERDQVGVVADAITPGIVGAVLLVDESDAEDPHYAAGALEQLAERGIPAIIGATGSTLDPIKMPDLLEAPDIRGVSLSEMDRGSVKQAILTVLEVALAAEESAA